MLNWLDKHPATKKWAYYGIAQKITLDGHYEEWEVEDLLAYFELIWTLRKKNLVDDEILFDTFSVTLIDMYEANDKELEKIISSMRKEQDRDELFIGVEELYNDLKILDDQPVTKRKFKA